MVDLSLHPHIRPGVAQDVISVEELEADVVRDKDVVVSIGAGVALCFVDVVGMVVVLSRQPNQPIVLHVEVAEVVVLVVVADVEVMVWEVVDSSRHPHLCDINQRALQ